jgi:HD superfamily phosphohydrolase YqeK
VQKGLGVEDEEIITAIRYHTTGRAGMGLLEKVLFLADFTSADRVYDDVDVMRRLVDEDMEVKKVLFRHELAYPLIIRADIDPQKPELMVNAVSGDYQATFYLMSEKGKLLMPNGGGVYDFTR